MCVTLAQRTNLCFVCAHYLCVCTRVQGCCCGASEPGALKEDPFLSCNDEKKYGPYDRTGGSAGSCPECKQGLGAFASLTIKLAIMHACGS
jgi:hypothetical protein